MSSNNPFAPPNAEVADPPTHEPPPPREIGRACALILVAMVLGLVTLLPGVRPERAGAEDVPALFSFGLIVLFSGLTIWLAMKIYRGRNWARWVMLAYLALGWWLAGSELQETFVGSPVSGAIDVVCIAMEAVACAFLTLGNGARWFSQLAENRRTRPGNR